MSLLTFRCTRCGGWQGVEPPVAEAPPCACPPSEVPLADAETHDEILAICGRFWSEAPDYEEAA